MEYTYKFPVVRGIQAGREYYIAMVPLRMISKLFPDEDEILLPEYRAQRRLNKDRIPVISKYITENRESYVFSALAASIDGQYKFIEGADKMGTGVLEVSMDSKFLINDGQHRKAAIIDALKEDSSLGNETISVVFFEDKGLNRSQQMFTDLNKHALKTSNSISELYDSRDPLAVATKNAILQNSFLDEYTDKEKDNLGKYSSKLFTLNLFYKANKRIVGRTKITEYEEKFLVDFWAAVVKNMEPWNELVNHEISKKDLRENYIAVQGVVIQALGRIGEFIYQNELKISEEMKKLKGINWKRNAQEWKNRTIRQDGRIIANETAIILTGNKLKSRFGIPLSEEEKEKEKTI